MTHTFSGRKPSGFIASVYCAASSSPILPCAGKKRQKSECFQDALGYCWCPEHAERGRLLNWAKKHGYPGIDFVSPNGMKCAIGYPGAKASNNEVMWTLAIIQASDDVIAGAARYVAATASQNEQGAE